MTITTTPTIQPDVPAAPESQPINLYQLSMLFVIARRAGNDPQDLELTPDRIDAWAIASFGTKDLLDPIEIRKRFQQLEKQARPILEEHSRPFAMARGR